MVDKVRWHGFDRVTEVSSRWSAFHRSSILVCRSWGSIFVINQTARISDAARGKRFLSSPKHPDRPWGPPSLLFSVYWGFYPEVKQQGREANLSPQSSAEAKDKWNCNSAPFVCLCGVSRKNIAFYPLSSISQPSGPRVCKLPWPGEVLHITCCIFKFLWPELAWSQSKTNFNHYSVSYCKMLPSHVTPPLPIPDIWHGPESVKSMHQFRNGHLNFSSISFPDFPQAAT